MYQTVGHMGVKLYADAMGLPLFRQATEGRAIVQDRDYCPTLDDEVEDLYNLLVRVKVHKFPICIVFFLLLLCNLFHMLAGRS